MTKTQEDIIASKTVSIQGRNYLTVAGRVELAHDDNEAMDITTELVGTNPVVIKATVKTKKGLFTGYSAANPAKQIEKLSPYEVAETSAIGRALGFAGYGIVEGIATADEIVKAKVEELNAPAGEVTADAEATTCAIHNCAMKERVNSKTGGTFYDHRRKNPETQEWEMCDGSGWKPSSF